MGISLQHRVPLLKTAREAAPRRAGSRNGAGAWRLRDEGRLKLWSVGPDGADDGGIGERRADKGKDIMIEPER